MFFGRSWDSWVSQYAASHTNPINRICHSFGIPMIVVSLVLAIISPFVGHLWMVAAALFVGGWALQFIGHVFEGKPPEFLATGAFCSWACAGGSPRCRAGRERPQILRRRDFAKVSKATARTMMT